MQGGFRSRNTAKFDQYKTTQATQELPIDEISRRQFNTAKHEALDNASLQLRITQLEAEQRRKEYEFQTKLEQLRLENQSFDQRRHSGSTEVDRLA